MKIKIITSALFVGVCVFGGADAGGEKKPATNPEGSTPSGDFLQINTGVERASGKWMEPVVRGDWIQMHVPFSATEEKEALKGLKVEIAGDAVEKAAILKMEVPERPTFWTARKNPLTRDILCLVRAVKEGDATVKITPVGVDGKERPVREITFRVTKARAGRQGKGG